MRMGTETGFRMALHCILTCSETRYPKRDLLELRDVLTGTDRDCVDDGEVGFHEDCLSCCDALDRWLESEGNLARVDSTH